MVIGRKDGAVAATIETCAFLWIYYGFRASSYEGINVEEARYRCGAALARADDTQVDLVAGVPDSGVGHAIGYAAEAGAPYRRRARSSAHTAGTASRSTSRIRP